MKLRYKFFDWLSRFAERNRIKYIKYTPLPPEHELTATEIELFELFNEKVKNSDSKHLFFQFDSDQNKKWYIIAYSDDNTQSHGITIVNKNGLDRYEFKQSNYNSDRVETSYATIPIFKCPASDNYIEKIIYSAEVHVTKALIEGLKVDTAK